MSGTDDVREPLVGLANATKRYFGVPAVEDISIEVRAGEIHALVGENGSGKSTVCKLMAGVTSPDEGSVTVGEGEKTFRSPADARSAGVAMVYQEFSLIDTMTVAQNLQLGREPRFFSEQGVLSAAQLTLAELTFPVDPGDLVASLGSAHKQMVEIAKAIGSGARVIMFDEPTATLSPEEKRQLFYVIEKLRDDGIGIVFVSHALEEALEHADRISVLRDGKLILTAEASSLSRDDLVRSMVGRDVVAQDRRSRAPVTAEPTLTVRGLGYGNIVRSMSFSVRPGEVVGVAGLVGSGRTETAMVVAGGTKPNRFGGGTIRYKGRPVRFRTPRAAVRSGVVYVTEDRKQDGFFETMNAEENVYLGWLARHGRWWISGRRSRELIRSYRESMSIRGSESVTVKQYSGGNQQKVVIAKAVSTDPDVIIFDEPTRGVDVGAIDSIHRLIRQLADDGKGVVVISSYLPEIFAVSDRILVTKAGRVVAEFDPEFSTEEEILFAAVH